MSTPRLWSWHRSPFAGKARIAFAEKGVEVELIEVDPRNRPARLRELNPTNRVPVLEVGDVAIRESAAICEWLEETHPEPPFWPADPTARAAARGLMRWVDDELTLNFFLSMRKEAYGLEAGDHPDLVSILRGRLVRRWARLEDLLARTEGPWLTGGDDPTLTDLSAIPLAVRLPAWKPELAPPAELTRTGAWLDALRERPSAIEVGRRGEPAADS
ncbi:MAG TPA: glutathione S-transferase family protein [Solirubrobacteraceae bacterium]|jgi:glutathione S-transferase|nr:glutathione S-transferase family protein [Solirubrobacteraceae bacterium]